MIFRVGIDVHYPTLQVETPIVQQLMHVGNNEFLLVEANTIQRSMKVFSSKEGVFWHEIHNDDYICCATIDLTSSGFRWEGPALKGKACGFGCLFNEDNMLVYQGFMFDNKRVCYGTSFYGDIGIVEYQGNLCENMKHGFGRIYDRKGECIYNGKWLNNSPVHSYDVQTCNGCEDLMVINTLVENITINHESFNSSSLDELKFKDYAFLQTLHICDNCFKQFRKFIICDLPKLELVQIDDNCFCTEDGGIFSITKTPLLTSISIGEFSFPTYSLFNISSKL